MSKNTDAALRAVSTYHERVNGTMLATGDTETTIQDLITDLFHLADEYGSQMDVLRLALANYQGETEGDDLSPFAELPRVALEDEISRSCGLTVYGVRAADHVEMAHEREIAPGTSEDDLIDMHLKAHRHGMADHTHSWLAETLL